MYDLLAATRHTGPKDTRGVRESRGSEDCVTKGASLLDVTLRRPLKGYRCYYQFLDCLTLKEALRSFKTCMLAIDNA